MKSLLRALIIALLLAGCSDDSGPTPDSGPQPDARADGAAPDAGKDAKALPPDGGATLAQLVEGAVKADCTGSWIKSIASSGAKPADVRKELVALDRKLKLKKWTTGYSYGHKVKIDFKVPELKGYSYDYTLYVPAAYKGDSKKPFALWVDPAHPNSPLKDTYTLKSIATRGKDRFIVVGINFMNVLYQKMDKASYAALGNKGMAFYQDNFSLFDEVIARVKRDFHIDVTKVYISGISAKGASSWFHGIFASDHYAAIHPVSIIPVDWHKEMYLNLMNMGVYVWQGDADTITPLSKVKPMIDKIKGYGLKVFIYVQKGGSHGGTLYYNAMSSIIAVLLKNYTRTLTPARVHKGIMTSRATSAYWLEASKVSAALPSSMYKTAVPPAVMDASWKGNKVTFQQAKGIAELKIKWRAAAATGPGEGKVGDKLSVELGGKTLGPFTLQEHPTLAVEEYCRYGDISRLWAGQVVIKQ